MCGAPGAGKSHVAKLLALPGQLGYKEINSDNEFTRYMKDAQLDLVLNPKQSYQRDIVRTVAKRHSKSKEKHAKIGRLGLVIDGTTAAKGKITKQKKELEAMGYECGMVYVSIPLDYSIAADRIRGEQGDRSLGPELVTKKWKELNGNINDYKKMFGRLFWEVDNSVYEKTPNIVRRLFGIISKWSKIMPKNKIAKQWMDNN